MNRRVLLARVLGLCAAAALAFVTDARAQWVNNGVPVSTATGDQATPVSVSDGAQGVIIAWKDNRGGSGADIYVQRLDATGTPQWTANGVAVCTAAGNQQRPSLISDGAGGAIIAWQDGRGADDDIFVQRVNANGTPQWTSNGATLCSASGAQSYPALASDGAGGAIVVWMDVRNGPTYDLFAQRVNSAGAPQWAANGVVVCDAIDQQVDPQAVSDGSGGAIISWTDVRSDPAGDLYAQRLSSAGAAQWTANGEILSAAPDGQATARLIEDGAGGAIVAWWDRRSGDGGDIYVQRVSPAGAPQWTADGVALCTAANSQLGPAIATDGSGGAIVTWYDSRSGGNADIYVRRVDSAGAPQWTADGVALSTVTTDQVLPTIVSDAAGGAFVAWEDFSNGANWDIYASRVNSSGTPQGVFNGTPICTATGNQNSTSIVTNGQGGAIIAWHDSRTGIDKDIYAQRMNSLGEVGFDYTIAASAGPNGAIFPSGSVGVLSGQSVSFTITPNADFTVRNVVVDAASAGPVTSYAFTNVTANHLIAAHFPSSGWVANGAEVSTGQGAQPGAFTIGGLATVADGAGGIFLAWEDQRLGSSFQEIYAQHLDASGLPQWTVDGVAVCTSAGLHYSPRLAADGAGGVIVVWMDPRNGPFDIFAQRLDSAGAPQWTSNGLAICAAAADQSAPTITSDGTGGAIIAWQDLRATNNQDIYVQRINASGVAQWTADGVVLVTAPNRQSSPALLSDGAGGAFVCWEDFRNLVNQPIYIQRINAAGVPQWTANGVALGTITIDGSPRMVSDGAGGAMIAWQRTLSGSSDDIYIQRVDDTGVPQWTAGGVVVCSAPSRQSSPKVVAGAAGDAIVAWLDRRSFGTTGFDIYAQRVSSAGAPLWSVDGVALCIAPANQTDPVLVSDGQGGAIAAWSDRRNLVASSTDIYAQRVNSSGAVQWPVNGEAVCTSPGPQQTPIITSDGSNGAIFAWTDSRNGGNNVYYDLYAQRVSALGVFGYDFTVTASAGPNGSITPTGARGAMNGSSTSYTITPATGYRVGNVLVNGVPTSGSENYTLTGITGDRTVEATFVLNDFSQSQASFVVASTGSEDPQGNCLTRGWSGEDLASRVFAHVSDRFLVNSGGITMATLALWFGADSTTALDQTRNWVRGAGYGNNWSQRLTSPLIDRVANPTAILSFDASVDFLSTGLLTTGTTGAELFGVQGQKSDGSWAFLSTRYAVQGQGSFTNTWVRGHGVFNAEVRLAEDGNETLGLATNTRLRIVVQTDSTGSQEDGLVTHVGGAAVVDNLSLKQGAADITPPVDFESGSLGSWTLSAMNGALRGPGANVAFTRDLPPPATSVALERGWDANDATCVWTFASPGDTLASGTLARLSSPWLALASPSASAVIAFSAKLNTVDERRMLRLYARGRNAGDLHPRYMAPLGLLLNSGTSGPDANAPLWTDREYRLPQDFIGAAAADSIQLVFQIEDHGEVIAGGLDGRPQTRLPILDDIRILQIAVDADSDGVADALDACATQSAAGQDADGDGCPDANATLHHVESWAIADRPIRFALSQHGDPAVIDGSDLSALRAGFAAWQGVSGAAVPLVELPVTTQTSASALDGVNLVTFEDDYAFPPNVIAITPTTSFTRRNAWNDRIVMPGQIVDSDMMFNPAATFSTSTTGPIAGAFDLQSVTAHEAGHFLGLSHSGVEDATMFPVLLPGAEAASLEDDDRAAIASAYPAAALATDFGTITGNVLRGVTSQPIPGALVFAVRLDGGNAPIDTTSSDYTREDGGYALRRLPPGNYAVRVTPLDGSVPGLLPGAINERVATTARFDFVAEWWDAAESPSDDPNAKSPITVLAGQTITGKNVITNPDLLPPTVISTAPVPDATGVRIDTPVLVKFSEAIADASIAPAFYLRKTGQSGKLGGRGSILSGGSVFVFTPTLALEFNTEYELLITTALTDRGDQHLAADFIRHFRTQTQPSVAIGSIAPAYAPAGAVVTILGQGFDPSAPATNRVAFNPCGVCPPETTAIDAVTPTSLVVRVPANAISGPVRVIVGAEASNNTAAFGVLSTEVSVAPRPSGLPAVLGWSPTDVALSPNAHTAYVVGEGGFATIDLTAGHTPVPRQSMASRHIALTPDGTRAFVTQPDLGQILEFNADPLSGGDFGTVCPTCATIPVRGAPDGIVLAPGGRRAYATDRDSARIYEIDTDATSATRGSILREISVPGTSLAGSLALDATGRALFVATRDAGTLRVDLVSDAVTTVHPTALAGAVAVAPDNREIVFAEDDGTLFTARGALGTGSLTTGSLEAGGSPRAVAFDPGGGVAYLADRAFGRLEVVGMDSSSTAGYHRVTGSVATGISPVAVAASANGSLLAVANAGSGSVSFYTRLAGLSLVRLVPDVASPGTRISAVATGGAFSGTPTVDVADSVVGSSTLVGSGVSFVVPPTYQRSVPVTLVDANGDRTLALPLEIVSPIDAVAPARTAVAITGPQFSCMDDSEPGYRPIGPVATSPDGELLAVLQLASNFGSCTAHPVFDLFRISGNGAAGIDSRLKSTTMPIAYVHGAVFTPDGRRLWVALEAGGVHRIEIFDTDPASVTFGAAVDSLPESLVGRATALACDPARDLMCVAAQLDHLVSRLTPAGALLDTTATAAQEVRSVATARDGRFFFVGTEDRAYVYDAGTRAMLGSNAPHPGDAIVQIEGTENGRRAVARGSSGSLAVLNLDSGSGAIGEQVDFGFPVALGDQLGPIVPAPDGHSVLVTCTNRDSLFEIDVDGSSMVPGSAPTGRLFASLTRSLDGRQLWAVVRSATPATPDSLVLYGASPASRLSLVSGDAQTGGAGATLPIPLRVQATDTFGHPQQGVALRFALPDTGNGRIDSAPGVTLVDRVTDVLGEAEVKWTLPAQVRACSMSISGLGVPGPLAVTAVSALNDAVAAPTLLALGPSSGASGIYAGTAVYARFDQHMDSTSVANHMRVVANGNPISGHFGMMERGRAVRLQPDQPLPFGSSCTLTIDPGAFDREGQTLANGSSTNFTVQAAPPVALSAIDPPAATAGAELVLLGQGFDASASGNTVLMNGKLVAITSASDRALVVRVPPAASSGAVTVQVGASTSNGLQFDVLAPHPSVGPPSRTKFVAPGVQSLAITPDGNFAYIANARTNTVTAVRLSDLALLKIIPVGRSPGSIRVVAEAKRAYVANAKSNTVSVIDINPVSPTYHTVVKTIDVGMTPIDLAVSPLGPSVVVVNAGDSTLSVIDAFAASGTFDRVVRSVPVGSGGTQVVVSPDGTGLYVATATGVTIVDLRTSAVVRSVAVGSGGTQVVVSPDGTLLMVLAGSGTVVAIDITPGSSRFNQVVRSVAVGSGGTQVVVSPDGAILFVLYKDLNQVRAFQITKAGDGGGDTGTIPGNSVEFTPLATVGVGNLPVDLAVDPRGTVALVINEGDGTLQTLPLAPEAAPVAVELELVADRFRLNAFAPWATAYLEPPASYTTSQFNLSSLRLESLALVDLTGPIAAGDHDADTRPDLGVSVPLSGLEAVLADGVGVVATMTGSLDTARFVARDTLTLRHTTIGAPVADQAVQTGSLFTVMYNRSRDSTALYVAALHAVGGRGAWTLDVNHHANTGTIPWIVPSAVLDSVRVAVVMVDAENVDGTVTGVLGLTGYFRTSSTVTVPVEPIHQIELARPLPNPATGLVRFRFALPAKAEVALELFDAQGRRVRTLVGGIQEPGWHECQWRGELSRAGEANAGMYFVRLRVQGRAWVRRVVWMK